MNVKELIAGNDQQENKWYFFLVVNVLITVFLIFCAKNGYLPLDNHYIPDSTFYENHVFNDFERGGLKEGFTEMNRILYMLGPQSFVIYNTFILIASIYCCSILKEFSAKAVSWARFSIAFNPYLLISTVGPSKECNLLLFSMAALYLFLKEPIGYKILAFIIGGVTLFIRPQMAAVLYLSFFIYWGIYLYKKPMKICLLILIGFFIVNSIPYVNELISNSQGEELEYFKQSNLYEIAMILKEMSQNPILQLPAFLAKIALTMFTPIARPNPIFAAYIPLLDWAYTFLAMFLFPLNFSFLLLFVYQKRTNSLKISIEGQFLIIYLFLGILSVVVSPNIQFRYLYPYLPLLAGCFLLHDIQIRNRIFIISSFMIVTCFILTAVFLPKEWSSRSFDAPFYMSWL